MPDNSSPGSRAYLHWALILLVLVALGLRLWDLRDLPPGLYYDEAFDALDAHRIAGGGFFPIYLPGNNGREPLYMYLAAVFVKWFGPTAYAVRLTSALVGVLTIPAVYFAAHTILRDLSQELYESSRSVFLSALPVLVAAAGIAVSFWHVSLSRLALRVVLLPLLSALAIGFFWRGWSYRRYRDYVWSGATMALALYAYTAARLLPFVVVLFVVTEMAVDVWHSRSAMSALGKRWRDRLIGLCLMTCTAALLLAPFAVYFVDNWSLFSARAADVSVFNIPQADMVGTPAERIVHNLALVVRSFFIDGDQNPRHNLPGRAVNDPLLAILFVLGWFVCLLRIKRSWARLLLIWLVVMELPTILSALAPHALRSAGVLPPLALIYGVGAAAMVKGLLRVGWRKTLHSDPALPAESHHPRPMRSGRLIAAGLAMLVAVVAISGAWTVADYFGRWAKLPSLGEAFDVDRQLAADQVVAILNTSSAGSALVSSKLFVQPQMAYALGNLQLQSALPEALAASRFPSLKIPAVREADFDPRQSVYLLSRQGDSVTVHWLEPITDQPKTTPPGAAELDDRTLLSSPIHQPQWPVIAVNPFSGPIQLTPRQIRYPLDVAFANGMRLIGYDVEPDVVQPGETAAPFRLTLFWSANTPSQEAKDTTSVAVQDRFDVFAHLIGQGAVWQTRNGPAEGQVLLGWSDWLGTDAVVEDVRFLSAPTEMPPGKAHFETGLYHYQPRVTTAKVDRIPVLDGTGKPVLDALELGAVLVGAAAPQADISDLPPVSVEFDHRIALSGWSARLDPSNPRRLLVDLGWTATDRSTTDYSAFVHLIDDQGRIQTQQDAPPGGSDNPTRFWVPGETIRFSTILDLPEGVVLSQSKLRIGLYEPVSGKQLPVTAVTDPSIAVPDDGYVVLPIAQQNDDQ